MREIDLEIKSLDRNQVLRCLNYRADASPSPEAAELLNVCTHEAHQSAKPCGIYTTVPIVDLEDGVILTEKGSIISRALAETAGHAKQMVFCLVTLGMDLDRKIEESADLLRACIWDATGTILVEQGAELLLTDVRKELGMETSLPFSPGYCDWPLEGQKVIFSAFGDEPLGIKVHPESLMMIPQKSISFVACLGIEAKSRNPCRHCALKRCFMRR